MNIFLNVENVSITFHIMGLIRSVIVDRRNINKICRICLEQKSNLSSLFTSIEFEDENLEASNGLEVFEKLTSESVETEDDLPSQLCRDCISLLKSAYVFQLKFQESSAILKQYLASTIKDETDRVEDISVEDISVDRHFGYIHSDFDDENSDYNNLIKFEEINDQQTCDTSTIENDIQEEIVKEYEDKKPLLHPCPICTVELPASQLRQHAHTHTALRKYLSIPKLKENVRFYAEPRSTTTIFNQSEPLHKCPFCNEKFSAQQFRTHVDNHKMDDEFKCHKCDRVFRKLHHLNLHRLRHLKEFPYMCNYCGKGFVIKSNYDCHILTHTDSELPHECSYCLKRFSNPEHLHRHQIIHTENISYSVKYRVCRCNHCLKTFRDRSDLTKHVCVPVEQLFKPRFRCKTCSKIFRHSSGLYAHVKKIHKLEGKKTLCSVCGSYVSNIYNHMVRHSGEKPYKCDQCDKRFAGRPQLRQHLLVHSGLKPYVCSVCAKAFNNLYNLQVHERIHKGDRCHICPICTKGFLEKSYLKKHMNVHKNVH